MATENKTKALDQLVSDLREAQGDNLASIVLYGATASNEDDHRSDHNVLVVLRAAGFDDLRSCSRALSRWRDAGEPRHRLNPREQLRRSPKDRKSTRLNSSHLVTSYAVSSSST